MTDKHHLTITAADHRRAAALIVHHGRGDNDGLNAIIGETATERRPTELLIAVVDLYQQIVPAVHTELGIQFLSSHLHRLAGIEETS